MVFVVLPQVLIMTALFFAWV